MQTRSLFVRPACTYSTLTPYALHPTLYTLHSTPNNQRFSYQCERSEAFFFFFLPIFLWIRKKTLPLHRNLPFCIRTRAWYV